MWSVSSFAVPLKPVVVGVGRLESGLFSPHFVRQQYNNTGFFADPNECESPVALYLPRFTYSGVRLTGNNVARTHTRPRSLYSLARTLFSIGDIWRSRIVRAMLNARERSLLRAQFEKSSLNFSESAALVLPARHFLRALVHMGFCADH